MASLSEEFTHDHQEMTTLLARLLIAIENSEDAEAIRIANELDRVAGPHVQFEETILYPELGRTAGMELAQQLEHEHGYPLAAIRFLQEHQSDHQLADADRERLKTLLQKGLNHVETCGRLVSHVTTLDPIREKKFLEAFHAMKNEGRRWTALGKSSLDTSLPTDAPS